MNTQVVLLAAGQSSRFKGIKQLASVEGKALINATLYNYLTEGELIYGINKLNVVLGANAEKIRPILPSNVEISTAVDWQQGMGSSISFAISQLTTDVSHIMIALADQIALKTQDIRLLLNKSADVPDKIVAAYYYDDVGAPAIFPRQYFAELENLVGDKGAKVVLQRHRDNLVQVSIPSAAVDIDTVDDLDSWLTRKR
jgi:molybdenum cofactor cytidylyltransferase